MARILSVLAVLFILSSCKKDKVPVPVVEEPSKGEVIAGQYKVYDTLGTYLYDMNIVHIPNVQEPTVDSLRFENFDGEFDITQFQSVSSNAPDYQVQIGVHNPLFDSSGNRWRIFSVTQPIILQELTSDFLPSSASGFGFHLPTINV